MGRARMVRSPWVDWNPRQSTLEMAISPDKLMSFATEANIHQAEMEKLREG
jgi:hypothetical protein